MAGGGGAAGRGRQLPDSTAPAPCGHWLKELRNRSRDNLAGSFNKICLALVVGAGAGDAGGSAQVWSALVCFLLLVVCLR